MMKQLTGLSRDRYALRRIALDQVDSVIREHAIFGTKVPSRVRRIYNIINQSDPDDLFGHMSEKTLRGYVFGEKPLPKYLRGRGKSGSPDEKLFKEERRFFGEEIHHKNPLAQNTNAINPAWKDNDLFVFHQTLREAQTGAGSTRLGLIGLIKDEHTGKKSIHSDLGGTKVPAFGRLAESDPELAAGEFILNNFKNSEAAKWWTNERGRKTMQVFDAPAGSPLQEAIIKSKGSLKGFTSQLQQMSGGIYARAAELAKDPTPAKALQTVSSVAQMAPNPIVRGVGIAGEMLTEQYEPEINRLADEAAEGIDLAGGLSNLPSGL